MAEEIPSHSELIRILREGNSRLENMARGLQFPFDPSIEDLRKRHTMYVRNLVTAYVSKFSELSRGVLGAIAGKEYLTYALCGRALIETTALLRYYVLEEYQPLFVTGEPSDHDFERLVEIDDRHLRGTHFDWQSFLFKNYEKMKEAAVVRLTSKKGKGPPLPPGPKQPRIGKCIESWAKEGPAIQIAYDLFCDLVHPNVGSSFLVASTKDLRFYFSPFVGNPVGEQILEQSFPILVSATQRPFGEYLAKLMFTTRFDKDVQSGGGAV